MIDHALAFNVEAVPERFAVMAQTVGLDDRSPGAFLRWLADLKAEIGVPGRLRDDRRRPDDRSTRWPTWPSRTPATSTTRAR